MRFVLVSIKGRVFLFRQKKIYIRICIHTNSRVHHSPLNNNNSPDSLLTPLLLFAKGRYSAQYPLQLFKIFFF